MGQSTEKLKYFSLKIAQKREMFTLLGKSEKIFQIKILSDIHVLKSSLQIILKNKQQY